MPDLNGTSLDSSLWTLPFIQNPSLQILGYVMPTFVQYDPRPHLKSHFWICLVSWYLCVIRILLVPAIRAERSPIYSGDLNTRYLKSIILCLWRMVWYLNGEYKMAASSTQILDHINTRHILSIQIQVQYSDPQGILNKLLRPFVELIS